MAKISTNKIPDINADWGKDSSNGLPYSGEAVQEFIKETFKSKYGYFHYDEIGSRYLVFADKASADLYLADSDKNKDLLLTVFDAPFNYSARISLISEAYNAVLSGSVGNTLQFKFFLENKSGDSTGENADCTITFTNGGVKKVVNKMYTSTQGRNGIVLDIDDYITEGTNNISIVIKGQTNLAATSVAVVYQVINLQLTDNFNISEAYNVGDNLNIPVTVSGQGSKIFEWYLDGVALPFDQTVDQVNSPLPITNTKTISLENVDPGLHSLQFRVYTYVEGQQFYSQTLFRNFFVKGSPETLIGIATELPIGVDIIKSNVLDRLYGFTQYVPYNIRYAIYNPANLASNPVNVYLDSELYSSANISNGSESVLSIIANKVGNTTIDIRVNDSVYNINTDVNQSSINIYEINSNLVLDLKAFGRINESNVDNNKIWTYKDYSSTFDGFYWNAQSGWVDNTLIINAGATLNINYAPLAVNPTINGKTMEFEFTTRNVVSDDSVVLDLTTEDGVGLLITASEVKLTASDKSVVSTKFKAGETNRVSFVINRNENDTNACLMFIYVNGIICGATNYAKAANIRCNKNIVFNSVVDVLLKQIRIYDKALTSDEILNNYILYRDTVSEMLSIYSRNDIYDALSEIDPEKIVNFLPVMYFTCLEDSKNTISGGIPALEARTDADAKDEEIFCAIQYVNAQDPTKNFSIDRSRVRLQGTSSIKYPKKNWRFYTATKYGTMLDYEGNVIEEGKYSFKDGSIPTDRWCLKADYAESSSSHNTGTARIWNDLLTKAQVTYSNPEKSSYFVLQGVKEGGTKIDIYTYYNKENEKLDEAGILANNFESYVYSPITRQSVLDSGLSSKAVPVAKLPSESSNSFKSNLFVMLPDENGVVGEYALMTNAQRLAKENGYEYDVRTCIDGFPIVVFYRMTENDPWIFLGKHNFNNDKSSENVFGFKKIPGFDKTVIPGSITETNPEGHTYGEKMQCWELLNNNDAFGFFATTDGFYDLVPDGDGGQIYRWEQAFEARYPDEGSAAPTGDLKRFADWMSTVSQEDFAEEKWQHLDVYKMAAYYIYLMRFGAADQVVKNSMFTSEDGDHFYFINYDNDTILGVKNDGRLVFDPTIDRQTPDPDFPDAFAYAGHDSVMWNRLEADKEFMDIVKAVDSALGNAGMTYDSMIDMFEGKQTNQWCERIYNRDAQLKYINPYNTGIYDEGLFSLQGTRNSHRRWWLSQRFNIYDAKFITGSFKTNNIWFKLNGAPINSWFEVTSGKYLPYGYEITNGASEVSDLIPVGDKYRFVIPQGVSVGDPILVYGAPNIKKLDMTDIVPYLSQISLAGAYSEALGSMLEELDFHGENVAENVTISGLDYLSSLKTFNVRGIRGIKELNLPNSLNLKTLLAKDTGLNSVNLAPGCLIETLELPDDVQALNLVDLPLLNESGLIINGGWKKVSDIKISNCPNLTSNFEMIWNWYNNTKNIEVRNVELYGVNWTGVDIDQLIELCKNTNIILKGRIGLNKITDKSKLLELEGIFDSSIFNSESDLYIYSTNQIFVFGPNDGIILEGSEVTLRTIAFCDKPGIYRFNDVEGERVGFKLDYNTGEITVVENGVADAVILIEAYYITNDNDRLVDSCYVTIKKRIYPTNVTIKGSNRISNDTEEYVWTSATTNVTGNYTVYWTLTGDAVDQGFVHVQSATNDRCVISKDKDPETFIDAVLKVQLVKNLNDEIVASSQMSLSIVNPNVIMTYDENPEVMTVFHNYNLLDNPKYMMRDQAESFTINDFYVGGRSIFDSSNIKHFNEFEAFTGVTTIKQEMFNKCSNLSELKLPSSVQYIESNAFSYSGLTYIYIPENIKNIDIQAFVYANNLETIEISRIAGSYHSTDGCIYTGAKNSTLYTIPSGKKVYVMPEETTAIYQNKPEIFLVGRGLRRIELNDKIQGFSGKWFMYGMNVLTEIVVNENHPDYSSYNGCVYDKAFNELLYWPSAKTYMESGLHESVTIFGASALIANASIVNFTVPSKVHTLREKAVASCTNLKTLVVPSTVISVGSNCFGSCGRLESAVIQTSALGEGMLSSAFVLKTVSIESEPTSLPSNMFNWCLALTSIEIPASVKSIGDYCFQSCKKLGDITCFAVKAPTLGVGVFGSKSDIYVGIDAPTKNIYVPSNATGYESGDWKTILQDTVGFTLIKW